MSSCQAHSGEVTHFAVLYQLGGVEMVVTASNADQRLRTWRVLREGAARIMLEPLLALSLQGLGIGAFCTSTGMGVSPDGVVALGFGNGRVCMLNAYTGGIVNIIHAHGDEVWDVRCAGGGIMVTSSRDRRVAVFRIQPSSSILEPDDVCYDVAEWVVGVKAQPGRLVMLGFGAELRILETP